MIGGADAHSVETTVEIFAQIERCFASRQEAVRFIELHSATGSWRSIGDHTLRDLMRRYHDAAGRWQGAAAMPTGKVARYFDDHGYGFIAPYDGSKQVFFHRSELPENKPPKRGAPVRYDVADGAKGKRAVKIAFLETRKPIEQHALEE